MPKQGFWHSFLTVVVPSFGLTASKDHLKSLFSTLFSLGTLIIFPGTTVQEMRIGSFYFLLNTSFYVCSLWIIQSMKYLLYSVVCNNYEIKKKCSSSFLQHISIDQSCWNLPICVCVINCQLGSIYLALFLSQLYPSIINDSTPLPKQAHRM